MSCSTFLVVAALAAVAVFSFSSATFLPKRDGVDYSAKEMIMDPKKRPFCNAFTGCGRKRSNLPPLLELQDQIQRQYPQPIPKQRRTLDESLSNLLELNSAPGLEDLSRQILSEAKLWEAIQEANFELKRQQDTMENQDNFQLLNKLPVSQCLTPPCYVV